MFRTTDRKIAWFGIGLSALALIPIFRDSNIQLISAYSIAFFALLAVFVVSVFRTSGPQFTTTSIIKTLTIHDAAGARASLKREQRIRVNYGSISELWCRNVYTEKGGTADLFKIDDKAVPGFDLVNNGPYVDIRKRFAEPVFEGHEATAVWEYEVYNSFPATHESLEHEVIVGTQWITLIVHLPVDRICLRTSLHLTAGGDAVDQLEDPTVSPDRKTITSGPLKSPKAGHTLRLSWDW